MLTPKIPVNQQPTGEIVPLSGSIVDQSTHGTTACHCQSHTPAQATSARPTVQLTPGSIALLVGGGTAAVLVIGAVLVSMLLAVAITASSLAITALVIRSILNHERKH
ncbi:SpdD-like protein [Streptomyces sp. VRA16 Mangrove soil]|uniref:SpdD-like protein n=1 Tax=Streptomyces sp. VRA16 Mangrove soil TaxID=2817434 RepID=UPI001A9E9BEB|nr:SpdD-like protein [Streptomyces sp. VRA16 Mangrove soil]MBO1336694.1 SpdD-like protein [Streptomyces sp. VRA16 Mangrove soil]